MTKDKKIFVICLILFLSKNHLVNSMEKYQESSLIPAGEFLMGTKEGTEIERPVHKVYLEAFRISLYEVSNQEFEMFQPKHIRSVSSSCDKCPVTMISWYQANSYCKNINARLPSEAEWEKAARGPTGYRYSFGKISDQSKSNFANDFKFGAKTVRSFQPNGYGLYNMSGNVWEWVDDWFSLYTNAKIDKLTTMMPNKKMVRGGSWYNSAYYINTGMRFKLNPEIKLNSIGFRCAWDVQ